MQSSPDIRLVWKFSHAAPWIPNDGQKYAAARHECAGIVCENVCAFMQVCRKEILGKLAGNELRRISFGPKSRGGLI